MKKPFVLLLSAVLLLGVFSGCGIRPSVSEPETTENLPTPDAPQSVLPEVPTTLMIYMVGSDLEAKSGAATNDLEEMAQSGIDLSLHRVFVYAGGTPKWHTEAVDAQHNTLLQLTEDGFRQIATFPQANMGDGACLTEFLNYVTATFPSERYALVMWDHGNGPVMGYGQDILYEEDRLLLEEMAEAMAASDFGPDNRLCWVGFDACLMASVELSCLWADYADYLVASQEVEPFFGWDYTVLQELGCSDVPQFLTGLTQQYLKSCEAYFQERGYRNREATLSCVDLSKAKDLEAALNNLFAGVIQDSATNYAELVTCRTQARTLGRSSTGSEYDLIDTLDFVDRLASFYPSEAASVKALLEQMVVANSNNTTDCCGISIFFPFYNKYYYEQQWQKTYSQLDCLSTYQRYLQVFEQSWLQKDTPTAFGDPLTPSAQANSYTAELTPQQQKSFSSARYYILSKESEEKYQCIFYGRDVTYNGTSVTANFSGKVLKIQPENAAGFIPPSTECGRIGDLVYYYIPFVVRDMGITFDNFMHLSYHVAVNLRTEEVSVCALQPGLSKIDETTLISGKLEDADLSQWPRADFFYQNRLTLTRDDNGVILPIEQWEKDSFISFREVFNPQNMQVVYEPLDAGEYYLILELQDIYGNRYCTEPVAIN